MSKVGKIILYVIGGCFAIGVVLGIFNIIVGTMQGKSMDQIAEEAEQYNPNPEEETVVETETETVSDKPDDFIENIDLNQALQLAVNNKMMLEGHFENPDLTSEEKISHAQEVEARVKPYRDTLNYLITEDSKDGGEYDYRRLQIYSAVEDVYCMAQADRLYNQNGNQEDYDNFYKYKEAADKYIDLANKNE